MDEKKILLYFCTLFFFSFLPLRWWLMVCYSLDTSVWWWRKFLFFFVVKGRHCSVQTWPVVNDRLVRFHASEKRVVLVSPPPPSKMFAARRRIGKRRKRGGVCVRTARRSSASKPLFVFARQRQIRLGNIATLMMLERERKRQFSRRSHTLSLRD
jgi:hypothetical protein